MRCLISLAFFFSSSGEILTFTTSFAFGVGNWRFVAKI